MKKYILGLGALAIALAKCSGIEEKKASQDGSQIKELRMIYCWCQEKRDNGRSIFYPMFRGPSSDFQTRYVEPIGYPSDSDCQIVIRNTDMCYNG